MTGMTAAVWTGTDEVDVADVPLPEVPQGWALVKIATTEGMSRAQPSAVRRPGRS